LRKPPTAPTTQPAGPHCVAQPAPWVQVSVGPLHRTGLPPQTPALHTSPEVQMFPSLHDVPLGAVTMAGHRGGPPPLRQVWDSRTWQADVGCGHTCLWQVSGPAGAAETCAVARLMTQAEPRNSSKEKTERRDIEISCVKYISSEQPTETTPLIS
jgi:hypothetical protein